MRRPNLFRRLIFSTFAAWVFLPLVGRAAGDSPVGVNLFEEAPSGGPRPRVAAAEDDSVRARRRVRVRRELLQAPAAVAAPWRLNLFPGAEFTAVPDRDEQAPDGDRVIAGTLAGVPGSQFLLVVHGEEIVADIFVSPLERYQLRREPGEGGAPEVRRLDPGAMPPCGGVVPDEARRLPGAVPRASSPGHPDPAAPRPHAAGEAVDVPESPGTFDVLIAYTPAARVAAGGTGVIEAQARLAVDGANQRYNNSGITTRARLVRTLEMPYVESAQGGVFEDLDHLLKDEAGPLADLRAARDAVSADVACLFVAAPPVQPKARFFIGAATFAVKLGEDGQPFGAPERAFSVVMPAFDVATTFAHEVGHNFGCQHDIGNVTFQGVNYGPGIFPFSYGYRFTDGGGQVYRDVMAYAPGQVIPYFSNPRILYAGAPTGTATADNARTMNATAPLIANLRRMTTVSVRSTQPEALEKPLAYGQFTLTRTGPKELALAVNLAPDPYAFPFANRVVAGVDYQPIPARAVFPAGAASVNVPVVPIPNNQPQGARPLQIILLPGDGYQVTTRPGDDRAAVRLRDTLTMVSVAATVPTAFLSPPQSGRFTFTRTGPLDLPLEVRCTLSHAPEDARIVDQFTPSSAPGQATDFFLRGFTIPAGSNSLDVDLTPSDLPLLPEGYRMIVLTLRATADYLPGSGAAYVVVARDPDGLPTTEFALTVLEPNASLAADRPARLLLTRVRGPESRNAAVLAISGSASFFDDYETDPGMAGSFGTKPYKGGVFIPPGKTSQEIVVRPKTGADLITQTVSVALTPNPNYRYGATSGASAVTVRLLGLPLLSVTATGPEARAVSDLGPVKGEFTLRREGDLSGPLTVTYTVAGSAAAGVQYKALPGVATFPAGAEIVRVKVKPRGDAGGPGVKTTVTLTLRPGDGYVLGEATKAKVKVFGGN